MTSPLWGDPQLAYAPPVPEAEGIAGALLKGLWGFVSKPERARTGVSPVYDPESGHVSDDSIGWGADVALNRLPTRVPVSPGEAVFGAGPIRAYHASPYNFDRFDFSHIGKGEGAQAYGHGGYFAGDPAVMENYFNQFRDHPHVVGMQGRAADIGNQIYNLDQALMAAGPGTPEARALNEQIRALTRQQKEATATARPTRYEVNINADPDRFLDWDKAATEQAAPVQEALQRLGVPVQPHVGGELAYNDIAMRSRSRGYGSNVEAAERLRDAGVPGIKYLDAGSRTPRLLMDGQPLPKGWASDLAREKFDMYGSADQVIDSLRADVQRGGYGADTAKQALDLVESGRIKLHQPDGSRNFVVFDDALVQILRKYGLLPPMAAGAAAAALPQGNEQ